MDQMKLHDELERKVEEHSLQIQQLHDEVDFKKWKIDSLIEKIDNLTTVVQQIQLNQIEDDNDIKNRVTALETDTIKSDEYVSTINRLTALESTQSTLKWVIGVGLTLCGIIIAYLSLKGGLI